MWTRRRTGVLRRVPLAAFLMATALTTGAGSAQAASPPHWRLPLSGAAQGLRPLLAPAGPSAAGHGGVDLGAPTGAAVYAAGGGTVSFAGQVAGHGAVSIDHGNGLRTTYEPVQPAVERGRPVRAGDVI